MVKGQWQQVQELDIPDNGLDVFLKDFGKVTLFRTMLKDQRRHYVVYLPEEIPFEFDNFFKIHDSTGRLSSTIERSSRFSTSNTYRYAVNSLSEITFFAAISAFVYLQKMLIAQEFMNIYQHQRELFKETVGAFVERFAKGKELLLPKLARVINA